MTEIITKVNEIITLVIFLFSSNLPREIINFGRWC